jgi:hypothetical protein
MERIVAFNLHDLALRHHGQSLSLQRIVAQMIPT